MISCKARNPRAQAALASSASLTSPSIRWARLREKHVDKAHTVFSDLWVTSLIPQRMQSGKYLAIDDASRRSGFGTKGSGCRVQGAGFRLQDSGFRVQGSEFRMQGAGCRVQGAGFRFQAAGSSRRCSPLLGTQPVLSLKPSPTPPLPSHARLARMDEERTEFMSLGFQQAPSGV